MVQPPELSLTPSITVLRWATFHCRPQLTLETFTHTQNVHTFFRTEYCKGISPHGRRLQYGGPNFFFPRDKRSFPDRPKGQETPLGTLYGS